MIGVCENPNHCLYLHLHTQCADSTIDFENGSFDRTACFFMQEGTAFTGNPSHPL